MITSNIMTMFMEGPSLFLYPILIGDQDRYKPIYLTFSAQEQERNIANLNHNGIAIKTIRVFYPVLPNKKNAHNGLIKRYKLLLQECNLLMKNYKRLDKKSIVLLERSKQLRKKINLHIEKFTKITEKYEKSIGDSRPTYSSLSKKKKIKDMELDNQKPSLNTKSSARSSQNIRLSQENKQDKVEGIEKILKIINEIFLFLMNKISQVIQSRFIFNIHEQREHTNHLYTSV